MRTSEGTYIKCTEKDIQEVLHLELRDTALQSTIFYFQGNQVYHCTSIIQDTRGYPINAKKNHIS